AELDAIGRRLLDASGARSAPELAYRFPGATCISVNEEAAHGVPGPRVLAKGDAANVDVSAELDGCFADTGGPPLRPPSSVLKDRLCNATRLALNAAVNEVRAGRRFNAVGKAAQQVARAHGFRTIKNLAGHGVGRSLHEDPEAILGYYEPDDRRTFRE